ncbi:MAG: chorismate pyruvate-lyase family protein [Actinomycetota bacterium]|nr:chorismate pyruvate-lyase family protein [Actinomycetota bacterium]
MGGFADRLAAAHFAHQRADVDGLETIDVARLDAFLRSLLFTDGTITRALEVQALATVEVEVISQGETRLTDGTAHHLGAFEGDVCLQRRVSMRSGDAAIGVWAESWIVPERLPGGFLGILGQSRQGIGQSMQGLHLESWRELLWFRLGHPPGWADDGYPPDCDTLVRRYRVITGGVPAILIAEWFAVGERDGQYRLLACADGTVTPPEVLFQAERAGLGAA